MKLIIDIPEQMYLNAKTNILCGGDILVSAIKNGIPYETVTEFADRCRECGREKVLNKISAEIKNNRDDWIKGQDPEWHTYDRCLQIVDKYKAEVEPQESGAKMEVSDGTEI